MSQLIHTLLLGLDPAYAVHEQISRYLSLSI